jgi:hypothetical protein
MKLKSSEQGWSDCYKEKKLRYKLKEWAKSHSKNDVGEGGIEVGRVVPVISNKLAYIFLN